MNTAKQSRRNKLRKVRRDNHKKLGLCTQCKDKASEGNTMCRTHLEASRASQTRRNSDPGRIKTWQNPDGTTLESEKRGIRAYMRRQKAKGLCRCCPSKLDPKSISVCTYHKGKNREYSRKRFDKAKT